MLLKYLLLCFRKIIITCMSAHSSANFNAHRTAIYHRLGEVNSKCTA